MIIPFLQNKTFFIGVVWFGWLIGKRLLSSILLLSENFYPRKFSDLFVYHSVFSNDEMRYQQNEKNAPTTFVASL